MELPELPESDKCFADDEAEAYTEDQMRAYGLACAEAARADELERCALIAGARATHERDRFGMGWNGAVVHIAAMIRKP